MKTVTQRMSMGGLAGVALLLLGLPAEAALLNGGFESVSEDTENDRFTLNDWSVGGSAEASGATLPDGTNLPPDSGNYQAVMYNGRLDFQPVDVATLESSLGVDSGQLSNLFAGGTTDRKASAIWQTFSTGSLPETLTLRWNFLTREDATNLNSAGDFGFFTLVGGGLKQVQSTLTMNVGMSQIEDATVSSTGYQSYSGNLAANTTYTLGFGVAEAVWDTANNAALNPSMLVVDNVEATPVPWEAEHSGLSIVGIGLLVGYRRYRRWRQRG